MSNWHKEKWYDGEYEVPTPTNNQHVKFDDIYDDMTTEYQEYGLEAYACSYHGTYIGYIAYDWDSEFYMFYHQLESQLKMSENILYDIADKVYNLNKERRLN